MNEEKNRKLDRYDDAFLFSLGLVGLIISFIEIGKSSLPEIVNAIPFLILGILLPFFIGYLGGAIELNSIEERMRGWIYFLMGVTSLIALFVFTEMSSYDYSVKESVFIFIIITGTTATYEFIKWSRTLFSTHELLDSYAFSATTLGVFGFSFLSSLIVGMYFDFQVSNIWEKILNNSTELLFWFSLILFFFSMILIFEKGSRCAIRSKLEPQHEHEVLTERPTQFRAILNFWPIKGLVLGLALFEYSFDFNLDARNLQARTLWILSFAFWSIGCLFRTEDSSVTSLFFVITIISGSIAAVLFYKSQIYDFRGVDKARAVKISYVSVFFVLMSLIFLGGNNLLLFAYAILWTLACIIIQRLR